MIIDLQRRLAEVGRIRIGQQVATNNGTRPTKLDTFRLTSADRTKITHAATLYGGQPNQWEAPAGIQWEVITTTDSLPVIVPPADIAFTQWYELWSAAGCQRRCDGDTETITEGRCLCDPENRECNIHTRLSVMLADLPGLGVWRVETSGYYAAVELQGAVEVVRLAANHGQMLPAQLRLEQRMVKRDGKTRRFAVPVLDIAVSPTQLLNGHTPAKPIEQPTAALSAGRMDRMTPVPDTVPERPTPSIADQALTPPQPKRKRTNAQQSVPTTGIKPRTVEEARAAAPPPPEEPPEDEAQARQLGPPDDEMVGPQLMITPPQTKKLMVLLKEAGFTDREARLGFVCAAIERTVETSNDLTLREASTVIDILEKDRGNG